MRGVKGSRDGALPRIPMAAFIGRPVVAKPGPALQRQCSGCGKASWSSRCDRCAKRDTRENFLWKWEDRGLDRAALLDAFLKELGWDDRNYDFSEERQAFLDALEDNAEPEVFRQILAEGGLAEVIEERDDRRQQGRDKCMAALKARWRFAGTPVPILRLTDQEARTHAKALLDRPPRYGVGLALSTRTRWAYQEEIYLQVLCLSGSDIDQAAAALGRSATSIAHRASDAGMKLPAEWRRLITKARKPAEPKWVPMAYPYVSAKRAENAQVLEVNELVARYLPGRADICQEILLALWEKRVTMDELRSQGQQFRSFVRQFNKANHEANGFARSLEARTSPNSRFSLMDSI